jgi:hypothetical protein
MSYNDISPIGHMTVLSGVMHHTLQKLYSPGGPRGPAWPGGPGGPGGPGTGVEILDSPLGP